MSISRALGLDHVAGSLANQNLNEPLPGAYSNGLGNTFYSDLNRLSQASQQAYAQQAYTAYNGMPNVRTPSYTVMVIETKLQIQIKKLVEVLPMSLASKLLRIDFLPGTLREVACFVVTFQNGHTLAFEDIDQFPSDEHVARIALECP